MRAGGGDHSILARIGIDIESPRVETIDIGDRGIRFRTAGTAACAIRRTRGVFNRIWTLREALAKALGIGFPMLADQRDYFADAAASGEWQSIIGWASMALPRERDR